MPVDIAMAQAAGVVKSVDIAMAQAAGVVNIGLDME